MVDDLEENLIALSALLKQDEVEILTARSGVEALELLLDHDVALAFLDVQMPDMDGFELAELIRGSERTRHVPLIFVTAGARDQHRLFKGYETGAVDFLYKPIEPHILRNKADVFFQLYRQKHQLAEELRKRTETLRMNELFIAILGHDLRNPLSAILMAANVMDMAADADAVHRSARQIASSGRRMSRMIEDVLDMVRVRHGGGMLLKPAPLDLGALVRRVVEEHRLASPDREIEVAVSGDLAGTWDADRLAQVVSNLVGNALQHGAAAPVRVVAAAIDADGIELKVENAGEIPPDVLPRLFDPFGSGHRENARNAGLGLGLYIVREIVRAHGGDIRVASAKGRTSFSVVMPRKPPAGAD